jgi:hypothetical protein
LFLFQFFYPSVNSFLDAAVVAIPGERVDALVIGTWKKLAARYRLRINAERSVSATLNPCSAILVLAPQSSPEPVFEVQYRGSSGGRLLGARFQLE